MTLPQSALPELLEAVRAGDGLDLARWAFRVVAQGLIDLEATQVVGAGRYERTAERTTHAVTTLPERVSAWSTQSVHPVQGLATLVGGAERPT